MRRVTTTVLTAALLVGLSSCSYPGIEEDRAAAAGPVQTAADAHQDDATATPENPSPATRDDHDQDGEKRLRDRVGDAVEDAKGAASDAASVRLDLNPHNDAAQTYAAAEQAFSPRLRVLSWDKDGGTMLWRTLDCSGREVRTVGGSVEDTGTVDGSETVLTTWDGENPMSPATMAPDTEFTVTAAGVPKLDVPLEPEFSDNVDAATSEFGGMCGVLVDAVVD